MYQSPKTSTSFSEDVSHSLTDNLAKNSFEKNNDSRFNL